VSPELYAELEFPLLYCYCCEKYFCSSCEAVTAAVVSEGSEKAKVLFAFFDLTVVPPVFCRLLKDSLKGTDELAVKVCVLCRAFFCGA